MRFYALLALILPLSSFASAPVPYCAGIRGNGQLAPAHWAALARLVEENGLPQAMAGGSSGSVTMFFVDSLAGNPAMQAEADQGKRSKMFALLLKSMPQFIETMGQSEKVASAFELSKELAGSSSPVKDALNSILSGSGPLKATDVEQMYGKFAILANPEMARDLERNEAFFRTEAQQAAAVFGKFDVVSDEHIFFRPGLVDFKSFAIVLGQIADFYAGNSDPAIQSRLAAFADSCAESAYRKQWTDVDPTCRQTFEQLVADYLEAGNFQNVAVFLPAGVNVPAFPATGLLVGSGVKRYNDMKAAYNQGQNRAYGSFSVDFDSELGFGYWGSSENLGRVNEGLQKFRDQGDLKSQKFLPLGEASWFEVLSVSPAEPGLANFQKIPTGTSREQVLAELQNGVNKRWNTVSYRKDIISAGGWSDLNPTMVLKAAGCENVAFVTRVGGEAKFAQQVFIRLTGETSQVPFWKDFDDNFDPGHAVEGTPAANTPWNKLYNVGNPASSFQRALRETSAVYCTNWNDYDLFKGQMWDMVAQSYASPVFLEPGTPKALGVNAADFSGDFNKRYVGCIPTGVNMESGAN
jgi:hypothetical protein